MNPFRNDQGTRFTRQLFYETTMADKTNVLYTLKESDHEVLVDNHVVVYPSIYRLYLESNDPTEYTIATQSFDGVDHWDVLCRCTWFQEHLSRMRRALELKMKSEALRTVHLDAKDPESKSRSASAKFLLERGYASVAPDKRRAGRPTKSEIAAEAAKQSESTTNTNDDFLRVVSILKKPASSEA